MAVLIESVLIHLVMAFGLFTIAKRRGVRCAYLAWVPVLNWITVCAISDQYQQAVHNNTCGKRKSFPILAAVTAALAGLMWLATSMGGGMVSAGPAVLLIAAGACTVGMLVTLLKALLDLFRSCVPQRAQAFWLISFIAEVLTVLMFYAPKNIAWIFGLLPAVTAALVFICRERDEGMAPKGGQT